MTKVTFTIEADSPEAAKAALAVFAGGAAVAAPVKPLKAPTPDAGKTSAPAAEAGASEFSSETVTAEMIKAMVAEKKAQRTKIKALLGEFGAESVTTLSEDNYAAFYLKLQKL